MVSNWWKRWNKTSASWRVLPFNVSVISDADATEMAQPAPMNLTSLTISFSSFSWRVSRSPHSGIEAFGFGARIFHGAEVARLFRVIDDDFLIQIVDHAKISFTLAEARTRASTSSRVL